MDEAAAATGEADGEYGLAEVSRTLEKLRLAWGDFYLFGHDDKGYWAAQRDHPGTGIHHADSPEELGKLLAASFEAGS